MKTAPSFVDLRHVNVDFQTGSPKLGWLLGRVAESKSVLRDFGMHLDQADQVVLYGSEGSGKSTLLRVLTGVVVPSSGTVLVNGCKPANVKDLAAGYVSAEESEPKKETVQEILYSFGRSHGINNLPARVGSLSEIVGLNEVMYRPAANLSTSEGLRMNIARAALSESPLVLLDGVADELGVEVVRHLISKLLSGRTVVVATRRVETAEQMDWPIMLLHKARLAQCGTRDEMAAAVSCQQVIDVWVEGLRYELLRQIRKNRGVVSVTLMNSSRFSGQRLRITIKSSNYLPSLYDLISQADLVQVREIPASLAKIVEKLESVNG